jgi:colanic acid/amylovoran biosynthesis glycosyltransferase
VSTERHVAYVLKRFPRVSETFIAAELIELQRQGERVTVFALSRPDEPFTHGFLEDLRSDVVYLPHRPLHAPLRVARSLARVVRSEPHGWLRAAAASSWPPRLRGWRRLLQATVLRDELERAEIDHVHAHFATTAARLAKLAWEMGGPSYSVTAHAKDIYHEGVRLDHLRDKLDDATFVATVSRANRDYLRDVVAVPSRVHVVPNAIDLRRLDRSTASGSDGNTILAVARLVEKKGLGDLVDACGILARNGMPFRLDIVGDGPLRADLALAATRQGVPAVFHGPLPYERVAILYRRATAFCLPCVVASSGDRDGLPTSVLEAMAFGVPVVTTAVNGLAEAVLDERTGLVVPEHDPTALAEALARILADRALARSLASEARRHVEEHFALERSVALLRTLFPAAA